MAIGNTDLGITLGARVDTSQAQKDINAFTRADSNNKTRKIVLNADINLKNINEKLEKAINTSGWTKKVEADMEKISTSIQRGLSRTLEDGTIVRDLTKVTETFKNEFGKIQERVTIFKDSAMRPLASSLQTVKEGIKEISTTTNTVVENIGNVTTKTTTFEKVLLDTNNEEHKIITTTKEWVDEQNKLHQEISTTNEKGEKLSATQNTITNDTNKVTKAIKEMGNALNGINNLPTDHRTSKITYVDKNGVKTVKEMVDGIDTLITKTKEYTTAQGALVKETKVFNKITGETKTNVEVLRDRQQEEIQKAKELEEQIKKEAQAHRDLLNEKEKALNQLFEEKKQKEIQKSKELEEQTKKEESSHRALLNEKEKALQQLNQEIQKKNELKRAQEQLNKALVQNVTSQTRGKTTQWGDTSGKQYDALITTIRQVDKEGKVTIKTIQEFTNAEGRLVQQTRVTDENLKKLAADEQIVSAESKTLGQALGDAIGRLAKYYIASLPIQAFRKGISEAITIVKDFDAAITEMGKVTNYSGTQLRNYTEDLGELGREVARTRTEMTEATTGWLKAGYSEEDAAKLAKYSALLQNTADEELSAAEATSILVSQLKAYHMEADEAVKVTDIINAVSAEQAVSSYDISQGLTVASAAMSTFGNSIEETTALLTAGTTVFQGRATQVARGLNMIATRIAKNEDALKDYDVAIYDASGQLKSTYQILTELSPAWEKMSNAERVALGNTLAGTNQYKILSAVMSQMKPEVDGLSTAEAAYQQALNASGTTMKQNAVYMNSLEARTTAFRAELETLVLGKGGLESLGKLFVSLGTGILSLINSLGGLTPLLTLIGGLVLSIKLDSIKKSLTDLGNSIKKNILPNLRTFVSSFKEAKDAGMSFGESLEYAASEVNTLQLAISALTLVVTAGLMIWNKYRQAQEEAKQTAQNAIQSYDEYSSKLTDTYDKIVGETTSKEELIKINKELSDSYDEEASKLKDINDLREEAIEKLYEEYILKNKDTARETAGEASKGREFFEGTDKDSGLNKRQELEVYGQILDDINRKKEEELSLNEKLQRFFTQRAYNNLKEEIEGYDKAIEANNEALENQNKTLVEFKNELQGFNLSAFPDIKKELENFSAGGHVDLTLRPVIDTEELNKQGYEAGKGVATVFSHTIENDAHDIAMNFTPIMVDPETGEYLGVMDKKEFDKYCKDVVEGVREDDLNLRIGAIWTGENAVQKADQVAKRICKISNEVAASMTEDNDIIEDSVDVLIAKYNLDEEEIQNLVETQELEYDEAVRLLVVQAKQSESLESLAKAMGVSTDTLKQWSKELGISESEILKNAQAMNFSIEGYYKFATAVKHAKELHEASKNLISSIGKLSSAFKEQAENGSLSVTTQLELIEAGYATALMYDKETGACKLNEKAVKSLIEAKLEMQIANLKIERSEISSVLIAEANAAVVSASAFLDLAKAKGVASKAYLERQGADPNSSIAGWGGNAGYLAIDSSEAIKQIDALNSEIDALQSSLGKIKSGGIGAFDSISKGSGKAKDAAKDANKELEELIKKYEKVIKYINKRYDREIKKIKDAKSEAIKAEEKKIKAVEKEKDHALDAIEKEIKALKKEQDARKKYWSDRIDALKKQNDALKDSLELQEKLDALEKARNTKVKVYKEGQGFVYDVDQTAVAKAQKELDEYLSQKAYEDELERLEALRDAELDNYEKRLDALNEYKDSVQENYEKQIEQMNEYKDQLSEQYDAQIDEWEDYKEKFGDLVDKYEEEQNRLLFEELMGIKDENSNWLTRLDNLAEFVRKYNELQMKLNTGDTNVTNTANLKEGTGSGTGSPNRTGGTKNTNTTSNNSKQQFIPYSGKTNVSSNGVIGRHASGISSVNSDEIAIVGENPNQEIVIGSKINNGELMNLGKGTGIVNADSSKTLAGMLNQVGQFGASGFGSGNGTLNNNINNDSLVVNGVTIQGANIKDPETFVNGLLNMKAEALQRAYRHR